MNHELKLFTKYYPQLCNTLTDIDNLLPHFVQHRVITVNDLEEISATASSRRKVQKLLIHISGPLRAGNIEVFYTMLRIMEKYGHLATQQLANQIPGNMHYCKELAVQYNYMAT